MAEHSTHTLLLHTLFDNLIHPTSFVNTAHGKTNDEKDDILFQIVDNVS